MNVFQQNMILTSERPISKIITSGPFFHSHSQIFVTLRLSSLKMDLVIQIKILDDAGRVSRRANAFGKFISTSPSYA